MQEALGSTLGPQKKKNGLKFWGLKLYVFLNFYQCKIVLCCNVEWTVQKHPSKSLAKARKLPESGDSHTHNQGHFPTEVSWFVCGNQHVLYTEIKWAGLLRWLIVKVSHKPSHLGSIPCQEESQLHQAVLCPTCTRHLCHRHIDTHTHTIPHVYTAPMSLPHTHTIPHVYMCHGTYVTHIICTHKRHIFKKIRWSFCTLEYIQFLFTN